MHNLKKIVLLKSLLICSIALGNGILKDYEKWWEIKCRDKKGLDEVAGWWGNENAVSRVLVRLHIMNKGYKSILDIPCGLAVDYDAFKRSCPEMHYVGIDMLPMFVDRLTQRGVQAMVGKIQDIPCPDSSFEVVYARHILEHLDTYKDAFKEMVRVAQREVIVVFFIKPNGTGIDRVIPIEVDGLPVNHNRYSKAKIEAFLKTIDKIKSFSWQEVKNKDEAILHIIVE